MIFISELGSLSTRISNLERKKKKGDYPGKTKKTVYSMCGHMGRARAPLFVPVGV